MLSFPYFETAHATLVYIKDWPLRWVQVFSIFSKKFWYKNMANVSKKKTSQISLTYTRKTHWTKLFAIIVFVTKTTKFLEKQFTGDWIMGHEPCGELSKYGLKFNIMKYVSHYIDVRFNTCLNLCCAIVDVAGEVQFEILFELIWVFKKLWRLMCFVKDFMKKLLKLQLLIKRWAFKYFEL